MAALTGVSWAPTRWPLATILVLLLAVAVLARMLIQRHSIRPTGLELPLLLVLLATMAATTPVTDWGLGLPKLLGVAAGVLLIVVVGNLVTDRVAVVRAMDVTIAVAGVAMLAGFVATAWPTNKLNLLEPLYVRIQAVVRGLVPNADLSRINPAEVGGVLIVVLPVLFTQALVRSDIGSEHRTRRVVAASLGVIGLIEVGLTQSRSAIFGLCVALAILGAAVVRRIGRGTKLGRGVAVVYSGGLVLAGVVGLVVALRLVAAPGADVTGNLSTFAVRRELWERVLMMIRDFPITGIGIGQFSPVFHTLYPSFLTGVANAEYEPHTHNLFLEFAAELGIPGALAFILLVLAFGRQCARGIRSADSRLRWTAAGLLLGMVGFLLFGLTDAIAPGARGGITMWWVLALGGAVGATSSTVKAPGLSSQPGQK